MADDQTSASSSAPKFLSRVSNEELSLFSPFQRGIIQTLRHLDPNLQGEQLRDHIADLLPPTALFDVDLQNYAGFYPELRDFLARKGVQVTPHSSRQIVNQLVISLYVEPEDQYLALNLAKEFLNRGKGRLSTPVTTANESKAGESNGRIAHNVAMRLKDGEAKFQGDLDQCWAEFVDGYNQLSLDYNLSDEQKRQFLHNLLSKDGLRFYLDQVQPFTVTYQQAIDAIDREYNSAVRQARVKNHLNALRVSSFVSSGMEISDALPNVYKTILKLSRQCPPLHRGDAHRIEFLRQAVVGFGWSHEPLSRVPTQNLSFQQLYSELETSLQLHKEAKLEVLRQRATGTIKLEDDPGIGYVGEARYVHHPSSVRNRNQTRNHIESTPLSNFTGCFKCGDHSHFARNCPKPLDLANATRRRLEYLKGVMGTKNIHSVLADICYQFEDKIHGNEEDDLTVFNEMLVSFSNLGSRSPETNAHLVENTNSKDIKVVDKVIDYQEAQNFNGACVDSGAEVTVIGMPQARLYCEMSGTHFLPVKSNKLYRFGGTKFQGLGTIDIKIPISSDHCVSIRAEVVECDVPLLLGLDQITNLKAVLDFEEDFIISKCGGWKAPLVRKFGHVYIENCSEIFFSESELRRLHRHFAHAHPDKLLPVLKRADPQSVTKETYTAMEKIHRNCDVCQRESAEPRRFRASLPVGDCVFNRTISIDIMNIHGNAILHIVDQDTKFNAAAILRGESTKAIWECMTKIWFHPYMGIPDVIAHDQGPQFTSEEWRGLLQLHGITSKASGVESHNALGTNERYHAFLRNVFSKVIADDPSLSPELALSTAVKAVNDTAGPSGLVPTLLVYGTMPKIPINASKLLDHASRMIAMAKARKEMSVLVARDRVERALRLRVPSASDSELGIGDEVLMFREKPVGKWVGPYIVADRKDKSVILNTGDRLLPASIDKIKRYRESASPEHHAFGNTSDNHPQHLDRDADRLDGLLSELTHRAPDQVFQSSPSHAMKELDEIFAHDSSPFSPLDAISADEFVVKIVKSGDPRGQKDDFLEAKRSEADGLKSRKIWKIIPKHEVREDGLVIGGRFTLTLKNFGTPDEKAKARYIAQGYKDGDKPYIVHNTSTLRASSIRLSRHGLPPIFS